MPRSSDPENRDKPGEYVVVARRYRPQSFDELVGQNQVSQALATAITSQRVGHAYLFTGARGVGKTSTARIFAKALNCVRGPTPSPCNECDICESIARGEDLDVLEIDGASNRGIDEIRQLRSNVNIRPSRARFKIYIIDEVHMLTLQAFNALLKTLEEPPEHVKFIFCTTDPEKIPITILSRCQRFDFPPVQTGSIVERLRFIVDSEGLTAEDEALQLLARRANGSMRDSQSLLEQLLSYCDERITVGDVHAMLGTARGGQLTALVSKLEARDVAGALQELQKALSEGVDAGQLAEQLIGYFRDVMAAQVGCGPEFMLHTSTADHPLLQQMGNRIGLETLLAIVQILDQAVNRMRYSAHVRTLLEIALVRICKLGTLDELSELISQLRQGGVPAGEKNPASSAVARGAPAPAAAARSVAAQKKTELSSSSPEPRVPGDGGTAVSLAAVNPAGQPVVSDQVAASASAATAGPPLGELSAEAVTALWTSALERVSDSTADSARRAERLATTGPNRLVASFRQAYIWHKEICERPDRRAKLETALSEVAGRPVRLDFEVIGGEPSPEANRPPVQSARQRLREKEKHPLVRKAVEMFDAEVVRIDESRGGSSPNSSP